jgi:DNA-binding NarL/FixJ family response regulator/class 3 adenylate cyclase
MRECASMDGGAVEAGQRQSGGFVVRARLPSHKGCGPDLINRTLTFLFTDVAGSTQLLKRLGRLRYQETLAEHQRLLRRAFDAHGGEEIDTQGDAFFVAFAGASDAAAAAAGAQRMLAAHRWPEGSEVKVRTGLHTGQATRADGRYLGVAVHRAARICSAAHGGQVLLSQTTHDLLQDEEEEPAEQFALRDLGQQRLKGLDRAVRLYQLDVPGLPNQFPPLKTESVASEVFSGDDAMVAVAARTAIARQGASSSRPDPLVSIRVLLADDQALVRAGFRLILDSQPDMEVVGEAADGAEAVERTLQLVPDVVLMDIRMPGVDGLEATRRLVQSAPTSVHILILTTFDLDEYVYEAMLAGASGFLVKDVPPAELAHGVRTVAAGDALLAPTVVRRLLEEFVHRPPPGSRTPPELEELTERELEVLRLVARGCSNAEIAADLVVAETTIKTHVTHVLQKLNLRDRVQAVVLAYEAGLVRPGG